MGNAQSAGFSFKLDFVENAFESMKRFALAFKKADMLQNSLLD
jgi:hypothetical protein